MLLTLLVLVERAGEVVAKADLMRAVWPDSFVEETGLRIDELRTLEHSFDFTAWLERTGCTGETAAQVEVLLGDRVSDGRLTLDKLAIRAVKGL